MITSTLVQIRVGDIDNKFLPPAVQLLYEHCCLMFPLQTLLSHDDTVCPQQLCPLLKTYCIVDGQGPISAPGKKNLTGKMVSLAKKLTWQSASDRRKKDAWDFKNQKLKIYYNNLCKLNWINSNNLLLIRLNLFCSPKYHSF